MASDFHNIIKESGLKVTPGRVRVLEILSVSCEPMTLDQIRHKAKDTDEVTVYRTLKVFVEKGLIYQTHFRDGKAYFEFQKDHHHHLVCSSCGIREHVDVCVEDVYEKIQKKTKSFKSVDSHMLEFFGICKNCS